MRQQMFSYRVFSGLVMGLALALLVGPTWPAAAAGKRTRQAAASLAKAQERAAWYRQQSAAREAEARAQAGTRAGLEARFALAELSHEWAREVYDVSTPPPAESLKQYQQALRECARDPDLQAEAQVRIGDYYRAHHEGAAAVAAYAAAQRLQRTGPAAAAAEVGLAAIDLDPDQSERQPARGRQRLHRLLQQPNLPARVRAAAQRWLGEEALRAGQLPPAQAAYEALVREQGEATDPVVGDEVAQARWSLALVHSRQRRYAEAVQVLTALMENYRGRGRPERVGHTPWVEWARYQRGLGYQALGQTDRAEAEWRALIADAPGTYMAILSARQLKRLGKWPTGPTRAALPRQQAEQIAAARRYGCGVVALRGAARLLGRAVAWEDLAAWAWPTARAETSLAGLQRAARKLGLGVVGRRLTLDELAALPPPFLAWVGGDHFVVVTRVTDQTVAFLDPLTGAQTWPRAQWAEAWSGIGLLLARAPEALHPGSARLALTPRELAACRGAASTEGSGFAGWLPFVQYVKPKQIPGGEPEGRPDFSQHPGLYVDLSFLGRSIVGHQDFGVPTRAGPLAFVRTRIVHLINVGRMGNNTWMHSLEGNCRDVGTEICKHQGVHAALSFEEGVGGSYTAPAGIHEEMTALQGGGYQIQLKDGTVQKYDASYTISGNTYQFLSSIQDRWGNKITYNYDQNGRLTSVEGPAGETVTLAYDGSDRVSSVTSPANQTINFGYDASGELATVTTSVRGSSGLETVRARYEGDGHNVTIFDPEGNRTVFFQRSDAAYRPRITDALGRTTHFYCVSSGWPGTMTPEVVTDPKGRSKVYYLYQLNSIWSADASGYGVQMEYDADKNLIRQIDRNGNEIRLGYDPDGNVTSVTRILSGGGEVVYDELGNPVAADETKEVAQTTYYTYEPEYNQVASQVDPLGRITINTFDGNGNLVRTVDALGQVTTQAYNSYGQRVRTTDAKGNATTFEFDGHGNLVKTTDPEGHSTTAEFDLAGNKIKEIDALDRTTTYEYDELNRLIKVTFPDSNYETYEYDKNGLLKKKTDAEGKVTTYTYTPLFQLASVTDDDDHTTSFEYDEVGNKTKMTDAKGRETTYAYDSLDQLTRITYPDSKYEEFTYDAEGSVVTKKGRDGEVTTMTYDALKRLVEVVGPGQ